jgi:diaminopropionate ammonia-lyase
LHASIDRYRVTPLIELPALAGELGVGRIYVKDEGQRFGLKAFKALGATYACYRFVAQYLAKRRRVCPPAESFYRNNEALEPHELTFCTATDGNHGRGVAWTARLLRQKAVVYMPRGTVEARIQNIRAEGAEVIVVDGTYDEAVERCAREAVQNHWQVISDTSWAGYEKIPEWIQDGYYTLFREIDDALFGKQHPDLVIVPGGVGALAAAAAVHYRRPDLPSPPRLLAVEPISAACLQESILSPDGLPVKTGGSLDSIMAGLNCGVPSPVAWPWIRGGFDAFLSVTDFAAVGAMRRYYYPLGSDPRVIAGESGAAALAGLLTLRHDSSLSPARERLGLGQDSRVLLLNTEADTDPANFGRLVLEAG